MNVHLTTKASTDLENIRKFLSERSPQGRTSVMEDIAGVIQRLQEGIVRGRRTPRDDVFELVSPKFGYVMPYLVQGQDVFVLRVYDSRQRGIKYSSTSQDL